MDRRDHHMMPIGPMTDPPPNPSKRPGFRSCIKVDGRWLTGDVRYRTDPDGKVILQVEVATEGVAYGVTASCWRDATVMDMQALGGILRVGPAQA